MKNLFVSIFVVFLGANNGWADTSTPLKGEVLLTISSDLSAEDPGKTLQFNLDLLKALPQVKFTTSSIWYEGTAEFTGVSLKALIDSSGFAGSQVEAVALNDYKVTIPMDSIKDNAPIVAFLMNGEEMSARDKGPLWVIYPFDSDPKYRSEVVYSRSIWQLDRLVVID